MKLLVKESGNWMDTRFFHHLPDLFLIPACLPSLDAFALAVRARTACVTLPDFEVVASRIKQTVRDDEAPLCHQWRHWHTHSIAQLLSDSHARISSWGLLSSGHADTGSEVADALRKKNGKVQAVFYNAIEGHLRPQISLESALRPRVERWVRSGLVQVPVGTAVRRARRTLSMVKATCPSCVHWSLVRTWSTAGAHPADSRSPTASVH